MFEWFKEELRLRALRGDYDTTRKKFADEMREARERGADQNLLSQIDYGEYFELSTIEDEVDWINTNRAIRQADRYAVPLPKREEGEDWRLSDRLGRLLLTTAGAMKVRREVAIEVDIRQKPWLNWLAVGFSAASLAVSFIALQDDHQSPERERPAEASPVGAAQSTNLP